MPKHINTPSPFRFDGHGINDAEGQRVAKVSSCNPYDYPEGQVVRNTEFDKLSKMFAAAPELLELAEFIADENNTLDMHTLIEKARRAIKGMEAK